MVDRLHLRLEEIGVDAGTSAIGVAFFDYLSRVGWGFQAERWFHAASTIKVPVLLGVYDAIERGDLEADSLVHVRNRFESVADGSPYAVEGSRDSDGAVQAAVGHVMRVEELARHMIVTSSNLATNVLVDLVGLDAIRGTLGRLGLHGIDLKRGVEDMAAWEAGINNRVTAAGLLAALRVIEEKGPFREELAQAMLEILHAQEFRSGIPAGLPEGARVAHKTGEISTVAHDAGIVFLPHRPPYVVVILTEWRDGGDERKATIARISREIYEHVVAGDDP